MIEIHECVPEGYQGVVDDGLVLDHEQRSKGRFRTISNSSEEVRVFLQRGQTLGLGCVLRSTCNKYLAVEGAIEEVTTATAADWLLFSKACYHLGNRHVPLQISERRLSFKPDHVLEDLAQRLGLKIEHRESIFDPEQGAYTQAAHAH